MTLRPPSSTRTDTLFPYSTLVRSNGIGFPLWLRGFVRPKSLRPRHAEQLRLRLQPSRRARISGDAVLQRLRRFRCFAQRHARSAEHTSELQSLMRTSYAVFCLKTNKHYPSTH